MRDFLIVLLNRIVDLQTKGRFTKYLRTLKQEKEIGKSELATTGSIKVLADSISQAIEVGRLTISDISSFVDMVEENGGQHVFFFSISELDTARLEELSISPEEVPRIQHYSPRPSDPSPIVIRRGSAFLIKQARTVEYWTIDNDQSFESETQKAQYWTRRSHRAVNSLLVDPTTMSAQIRISRVSNDAPRDIWKLLYSDFWNAASTILDLGSFLEPEELWLGFRRIVLHREGTFMAVDSARNPQIHHHIKSRREAGQGIDIRDLEQYDMDDANYARDALNIWWDIPSDIGDEKRLHTVLSKESVSDGAKTSNVCKLWLARHISPEVLENVVGRIREIAN